MDKTLQTRQNYPNKDKKNIKDNGTFIFYLPNISTFPLHSFFYRFQVPLKITWGKG